MIGFGFLKRWRRERASGFSLMEVVLVLFLSAILLYMVSNLLSRTLETLRFLKEKNLTLESATLGCERLASELMEAVVIDLPIGAEQVAFYKVKPGATPYLANDPESPPENWKRNYQADATGTNQLTRVVYRVDSGSKLVRQAEGQTSLVATDVNTFTVNPLPAEGSFEVKLALQEKRRVVVFETVVTCPALREGYSP